MSKIFLTIAIGLSCLLATSSACSTNTVSIVKLPWKNQGCNLTTSFELDHDQEVLVSASAGGKLPRNKDAIVAASVVVGGRECLSALVGRNNTVRERSIGGSCSVVALNRDIKTVEMITKFSGGTSCQKGELRIEERPRQQIADLVTQRSGFTTVETLLQRAVTIDATVRAASKHRSWVKGVVMTAPSDFPICAASDEIPLSNNGRSVSFSCSRQVDARKFTTFSIEAIRRGRADYDYANFHAISN